MTPPRIDTITLNLHNRDEVIAFINRTDYHAEPPEDAGSDVIYIDLPAGRRPEIVVLGETVTLTDTALTIGRGDTVRATLPKQVHENVTAWDVGGATEVGGWADVGAVYVHTSAGNGLGDEIAAMVVSVDPVTGGLLVEMETDTSRDPAVPVTFILNNSVAFRQGPQ
jgi:hypothetical protein